MEGEAWHPPHWPVAWQRHATHAAEYLAELGDGARLDDVGLDVVHRGTTIGRWVARQRSGWDGLNAAQREQLRALGLTPPATVDTSAAEAEAAAVPVPDGPGPSAPASRRGRSRWGRRRPTGPGSDTSKSRAPTSRR
ncbi:helicase associated domain-containing protein [Embleya sp. NPDC005971]|uniref:helicase associated domain-containing protein n=1 Tax=Embleya sp. NPDC005971 TaxID=3156724 RepID=UPI0033D16C1E